MYVLAVAVPLATVEKALLLPAVHPEDKLATVAILISPIMRVVQSKQQEQHPMTLTPSVLAVHRPPCLAMDISVRIVRRMASFRNFCSFRDLGRRLLC